MQVFVFPDYLLFTQLNEFEGRSVREFLTYFRRSRKNIYLDFLNQRIQVNGNCVKEDYCLKQSDELVIYKGENKLDYEPSIKRCEVLYEDDLLLAVHKEKGIIIHDDSSNEALANQVAAYYVFTQQNHPVRYLHRLDRETSGIVLFSKELFFQPLLDEMMQKKEIHRCYYAWVKGKMKKGSFIINKPIGKDRHVNGKMCISSTGKEAITHVEVIRTKGDHTLVRCILETGRTHQIRVHLSSIGHSIVNDEVYGTRDVQYDQMALWAYQLELEHPITHESMSIVDHLIQVDDFVK